MPIVLHIEVVTVHGISKTFALLKITGIAICVLALLTPVYACKAEADVPPHPLGADYRNAAQILYLEDGRIVFAMLGGKTGGPTAYRKVESVRCVDGGGKQLWKCDIPPIQNVMTPLVQTEDGSFAVPGKAEDNIFHAALVDSNGQFRCETVLPPEAQSPYLTPHGAIYVRNTADGNGRMLSRMNWDGGLQETVFEGASNLTIMDAGMYEGSTCVCVLYQKQGGQKTSALLGLDGKWNIAWQYDAGPFEDSVIQAWTGNDMGGVTFVVQRMFDTGNTKPYSANELLCLRADGTVAWKSLIQSDLYFPDVHVMEQKTSGNYCLWGRAGASVSQDNVLFVLTIDREGNYLSDRFALLPLADCHKYLDGQVYAVPHDAELNAIALVPFEDIESVELSPFIVVQ